MNTNIKLNSHLKVLKHKNLCLKWELKEGRFVLHGGKEMVLGGGGTRLSLGRFLHTEMGVRGQREKVPRDPCKKKHRKRKTQSLYGEHGIVFFSCSAAAQYHLVTFFCYLVILLYQLGLHSATSTQGTQI